MPCLHVALILAITTASAQERAESCPGTTSVSIGIIGAGVVGQELLSQLLVLSRESAGLRTVAILRSQRMWLQTWEYDLQEPNDFMNLPDEPTNFTKFTAFMSNLPGLRVIMDCTPAEEPADLYESWLAAGINVVTANKRAGSGNLKRYKAIRRAEQQGQSHFQYEATVGAGLPVMASLHDMMQSGDDIHVLTAALGTRQLEVAQ